MADKKKPAGALSIVAIIAVSVVAALAGAASEAVIMPSLSAEKSGDASEAAANHDDEKHAKAGHDADAGKGAGKDVDEALSKTTFVPLEPITVSLMDDRRTRVRVVSIALLPADLLPEKDALVAQLQEDIAAYLRTLSIGDIDSGIGLSYLRDDFAEIIKVRSNNPKARLMIAGIITE
jgi:flagellar basal body-associated protein FliL